jgi:signal transduction histidine kinase
MATENRFAGAVAAAQEGFNRVAARLARLSFWQFVLLAVILLAAAGISQSLWDKPATRQVRVKNDRPPASADKRDAKVREKGPYSAEIRISEDGVVIRRKAAPEDKGAVPPTAPQDADKPASTAPAPSATDDTASAKEPSGEEVLVSGIELSDGDIEDIQEITRHARRPALVSMALLLVLALFVMRMFARGQQRAEKKADAALAVADREALQRQIVEARLQLLQAQVEPHFLFNTLAAVEHLIETTPARAAQMQRHLIDYLRAALPRMRQQSATLGQEVELCVNYLKIMQMRMDERLKFNVTVPAGLASAAFPPMMIQSLVENSIRHGLEPKPEGGVIDLTAEVRDGKLCVSVIDTGMGFSPNAGPGIGLANIRERLQQLFDAKGSLTMEPNSPSGTRAVICVPYAVA